MSAGALHLCWQRVPMQQAAGCQSSRDLCCGLPKAAGFVSLRCAGRSACFLGVRSCTARRRSNALRVLACRVIIVLGLTVLGSAPSIGQPVNIDPPRPQQGQALAPRPPPQQPTTSAPRPYGVGQQAGNGYGAPRAAAGGYGQALQQQQQGGGAAPGGGGYGAPAGELGFAAGHAPWHVAVPVHVGLSSIEGAVAHPLVSMAALQGVAHACQSV